MALSKITNASVADTAVHGRRNLAYNGAMRISQRGSVTGITSSSYTLDRYALSPNSMGTYSVTQSTESPDGFRNSLKVDVTTADASPAAGDYVLLLQRYEGQDLQHLQYGTSNAKDLTLSFWVRSNKTGTYAVDFFLAEQRNSIKYTINTADTWEHKTLTVSGNTTYDMDDDNSSEFTIMWFLGAGSNHTSGTHTDNTWHSTTANVVPSGHVNLADNTSNEWYITGVQLEVGDTATPFEHRSYGEEEKLCQRYYWQSKSNEFADTVGSAYNSLSTIKYAHHVRLVCPQTMRAYPDASRS